MATVERESSETILVSKENIEIKPLDPNADTLPKQFLLRVQEFGDLVAMRKKRFGIWQEVSQLSSFLEVRRALGKGYTLGCLAALDNGKLLNTEEATKHGLSFVEAARLVTLGHHLEGGRADIIYNPLGYGLSLEKTNAALELGEIQQYVAENITEKASRARAIYPLEKSIG